MIQIVPFKSGDIAELNKVMACCLPHQDSQILEKEIMDGGGNAWSAINNGQVIGCAGVKTIHPGVGEAWTYLSSDMKKYKFTLHKQTLKKMAEIAEKEKYHRIQALVKNGFVVGYLWMKHLGFNYECCKRMYGPSPDKSDYHCFYRLY